MTRPLRLKLDQIHVLIAKDFKLKYNSTALGFAWSLLVPLLMSFVYYIAFGVIMRFGRTGNYMMYVISGNFLWHFFANVVNMNGRVLSSNSTLLKKTSFDRKLLIWGTFFTEAMHFVLTIPVLIGIMAICGIEPQWWSVIPNLLVAMIATAWLSVGVGYIYSGLNLFFRDLDRIMGLVMMAWLYASPVFIPYMAIPEKWQWVYQLNPAASILMIWRDIFYEPAFHPDLYVMPLAASFIVFVIGRAVFKHYEPRFAEMM